MLWCRKESRKEQGGELRMGVTRRTITVVETKWKERDNMFRVNYGGQNN